MGRTAYIRSLVRALGRAVFGSGEQSLLLGVLDGGTLETRIMRLIDGRLPWAGRYRLVLSVCCWMGMVVLCVGAMWFGIRPSAAQGRHRVPLYGQILHADGPRPSFEVATIRRVPNGLFPTHGTTPPDRVRLFFSVKMLVFYA
jgi:hypothetical protein